LSVARSTPRRRARAVAPGRSTRAASRRRTADSPRSDRTAIIDIGSNTIRLVVYEGVTSLSAPLFNEKIHCELARGLADSGRLNPDGRARAMAALSRFSRLARTMGARKILAVATAAVRVAKDGESFVASIRRRFRITVQVLSGPQEARLSAHGFLANTPTADGVFADLGGGSLELVSIVRGRIRRSASLMLGHLVLAERSDRSRKRAVNIADHELSSVSWLGRLKGRNLYITGGAWRAIARIVLEQTNHPLHIIDGFEADADRVSRILDLLSSLSQDTLLKIDAVSSRRVETLPFAALILRRLIEKGRPGNIVFSGFGIREGVLLSSIPGLAKKKPDLLIEAAAAVGRRMGRFFLSGDELCRWLDPLFRFMHKGHDAHERRLRLVAGHLFDIARFDHPDYRAEHALTRVLHLPIGGLSHADRAFVALAIYIRYNGKIDSSLAKPTLKLLDTHRLHRANILGLAFYLAQALSGGTPGVLKRTALNVRNGSLILKLPRTRAPFWGETVERRLKVLGRTLDLKPALR
jgi:exopolyphosphatase/guanosine-5'-triphosphate,3'-diphosphate pyrophosphatase